MVIDATFVVTKRKAEKVQATYSGYILPQKSGRIMIKIKKVIK